jgi:hypothetical protein
MKPADESQADESQLKRNQFREQNKAIQGPQREQQLVTGISEGNLVRRSD